MPTIHELLNAKQRVTLCFALVAHACKWTLLQDIDKLTPAPELLPKPAMEQENGI